MSQENESRSMGCLTLIALVVSWMIVASIVYGVLRWITNGSEVGPTLAGFGVATAVIGVFVFARRGMKVRVPGLSDSEIRDWADQGECPVCGGGVVWADGRCSHCGTSLDAVNRQ